MQQQKTPVRITGGTVITMDRARRIIEDGAVCFRDGVITWVGDAAAAPTVPGETVIFAGGGLIIPGLINTHTHISMSVFRTLADDMADRLKRYLFPLEARFVTEELVYWAALHSLHEMIRGGTSTLADMYYFPHSVARACDEAGVRALVGETIVNFPAPDAPEPYGGIARFEELARDYSGHPLITPALAPHAPYTLNEAELRRIAALADEADVPVMSHLAEMDFEVAQLAADYGETPVAHYHRLGLLSPRLIAAHCIHVNDTDIAMLRDADCGIAHNPVANMKAGKGTAPIPAMVAQGLRVGLGTDGPMSGNTMDLFHIAAAAAKVHKMEQRDRTVMPAQSAFELATIGGARALHMEDRIGSLEVGKRADLAVVSLEAPHMFPVYDPYAVLVYCAGPTDVQDLFVDGRHLLKHGELQTVPTARVRDEVSRLVAGVRDRLSEL
ncbi:MAG: amidohydrolase [Spirochaetaceae bacterium]|nr:MAG: amidohydrolase [Spirochaetaceae bacterium]